MPTLTWGNMIRDGVSLLLNAPWLSISPGLAILTSVLAFNLIGDGVRDRARPAAAAVIVGYDPRWGSVHAMSRLIVVAALVAASVFVPGVSAQGAVSCLAGQAPRFVFGFADLHTEIGEAMGEPVTCEFPDPNGTGDVHQRTTTGLAFWRKSTNTPTFTNGFDHWASTPNGSVRWTGSSIDPPAVQANVYPAIVVDSFMDGCTRNAPSGESTCRCAVNKIQARFTLAEFLEFGQRLMDANPDDEKLLTGMIVDCVLEGN